MAGVVPGNANARSCGRPPIVSVSATGHGVHWNATIGVNASGQTAVQFNWLPGR
jgi:hypothetical protein